MIGQPFPLGQAKYTARINLNPYRCFMIPLA